MMLSITRSMLPYTSTGNKFKVCGPGHTSKNLNVKHECQFLGNQRLEIFCTSLELLYAKNTKILDMAVYSNGVEPGPPLPSDPFPSSWKAWILGVLVSIIIPCLRNKWGLFLVIEEKVESAVHTADEVLDVVEEVAEEVGKIAEEVSDHLPEGGKLQQVATFVENAANETAKDAHQIDEVIEKIRMQVEEVENELEVFSQKVVEEADGASKEAKA